MRVLVTGAGGFLGGHLVDALLRCGHEVEVSSTQTREAILGRLQDRGVAVPSGRVGHVSADGLPVELPNMGRIDAIIHGAFPRNLGGGQLAVGLDFQAAMFQAIQQSDVGMLINVSSQSVYDAKRTAPAHEQSPLDLDSPYATAKYASEVMADSLCGDADVVHARLASLLGVGFGQRVVNKLVARALEDRELHIVGGGQCFGFMDVRDAADALLTIVHRVMGGGQEHRQKRDVVNIGVEASPKLGLIADTVARVVGEHLGEPVAVVVADGEAPTTSSALDVTKLSGDYGFHPHFPLEQTVQDILDSLV